MCIRDRSPASRWVRRAHLGAVPQCGASPVVRGGPVGGERAPRAGGSSRRPPRSRCLLYTSPSPRD
eukprot:9595720-Alexandrium_andersonii.AAC.1